MTFVREMSEGDLGRVYEVASASLDQYYDPSVFFYFRTMWPSGQLVACDVSGVPIAFLTSTKANDTARIMMFAVSPFFRSKGIGQSLLDEFRRMCLMCGVRNITLEVRTTNIGARKFYRRNGFVEIEVMNDYYTDGGQGIRMMAPVFPTQ